jgi:5'-nucleotidase (lipoprotein e(P4) family)
MKSISRKLALKRPVLHHLTISLFLLGIHTSSMAQTPIKPTNTTTNTTGPSASGVNNALLYAVAWKKTAAEYRALYYQGFNIARIHVQNALDKHKAGDKPLAIVTDMDDTILNLLDYWSLLINQNKDYFDDAEWDKLIPENKITASPGSTEFLKFCADNKVEVFYVTSRDQGEKTYEYALGHLKHLGFPYADTSHLTVLQDTSNKEKRQDEIMKSFNVVVFLGDNLNDFRRKYYIKNNIDARIKAMEADRDQYGVNYILFPNPTDGHWLAAIYGESEPLPTNANRELMKKAASKPY